MDIMDGMDEMDDKLVQILFLLFGLYAGVMSWLFKSGWNDVQILKKELAELRTNCAKCQASTLEAIRKQIDERFDKIEELVERKVQTGMDAGFTNMELKMINSGQISPKKQKREA